MPGFPVFHHLPEFAQTHCSLSQWCHPTISSLSPPSPLVLNLSQHQGLSQWAWWLIYKWIGYDFCLQWTWLVIDMSCHTFFNLYSSTQLSCLGNKGKYQIIKEMKPLLFGLLPVLETPHPQFFLLLLKIQIPIWASFSFHPFFSDDPTYSHFFNHHLHLDFFPEFQTLCFRWSVMFLTQHAQNPSIGNFS